MKGLLKILLGLVGAIVLLLVLTAVLLPLIFDKNDLKQAIAGEVYAQTGRELRIDGELDFSVFPLLAVEVNDLSLSNAQGFGDQSFARIGQARVGVALMPLFQKQFRTDEITLDGLELALAVNARGQNNWDDLAGDGEAEAAPAIPGEPGMFSGQRVAGLNIREARIEFQDQQAGTHYRLSGLSAQTGALGNGIPVPVELTTVLEDLAAGSRADIELTATADIDLPVEQYVFEDIELTLVLEPAGAATNKQAIFFRATRIGADLAAQTLQLETFSVQVASLRAEGSLFARNIFDSPTFSGSLELAEFSPARLLRDLQMETPVTADPDALQRANLQASFSGNASQLALENLILELDRSRFNGEMSVRNFDQPKISFQLAVDEIDLDRYLEPASDEAAQADVAMPREELQGQEVQGRLTAERLHMAGLDFSNAEVGVTLHAGRLRLNPLTAEFYGGSYSGDITLDSSGVTPVLSLDEKVDSIAFQRLVADLVDNDSLSGTALGHVRLTGRGANSSEVLGSLNGDLGLTLTEGALEGINIWYEIRRGMALYKGLAPPPAEPERTVFSRMQLAASVKDGVVTTRKLAGELPFLTVSGNGAIDLGQSRVDLGLVAAVRNSPELSKDPLGSELRGKSLPFKVSGSLDDPSVSVDFEALLKSEATGILLNKLGLTQDEPEQEGEAGEPEEASSEDQLEQAAKGALFNLLRGKDKDEDEDDGGM
jgi:AsmA protein